MKKQFFRVKQLADQTFSRSGKTEALSDDLQAADKKIEFIKLACSNISRRLSTSLLAIGQDAQAKDKRLRKCTDYLLSLTFLESSNTEEDSLLRYILLECSKIQMCLANAFADYDARVENNIVIPLNQIVDVDVPNVMKQKRNLTKLILDMDSARNRYHAALKHNLSTGSGTNMAKIDSIKDELEDIEFKVEQCRDALASDMFQIISKESEIADLLLQYIKHQQAYHKTALTLLDEMVPEIEAHIGNSNTRRVFGIPLEEHLRITHRKIAYPIELCICTLLELGMEEEGLFRVAGGASKVRRMKLSFDANCMTLESAMEYRDIHVISSVLKCYLRELPEPLLTYKLYNEWMAAIRCTGNENDKLAAILNVVKKLPEGNFDNLRYVIKFLNILTKNQDVNKMTSQNLAIVIAPNLIWSPDNNSKNMGLNMNVASQHNAIVECLVSHADHFFPDDEMFYISLEITKKCHTRSNSADIQLISTNTCTSEPTTPVRRTQSSDSLVEEPSSVINVFHESPKPVTRTRKNKPAPVPPIQNTIIANKSSNDLTKLELHFSNNIKAAVDKENVTDTISVSYNEPLVDMTNVAHENSNKCLKLTCIKYDLNDDNKSVINVNKPEQMQQSESKPIVHNKCPTGQNVVANSYSNCNSSLPSPRQVNASADVLLNEEVILRKPTIPERPASLQRPFSSSFRKLPDLLDSSNIIDKQENHHKKGPSLERTHLYSVDKQQVKIHVKNSADEEVPVVISCTDNASSTVAAKLPNQVYDNCEEHGSAAIINNIDSDKKSAFSSECAKSKSSGKIESPVSDTNIILAQQPSATENKIQSTFSSNDTEKKETVKVGEKKPERPPKPESICVRSNSSAHSSSHTRAFSDGHNIDIYGTVPGSHHRTQYKIQRPLPPPPPPPILADKHRHSSTVDSTNL